MKLRSGLLVLLFGAVVVGPGTSRAVTIVFDVSGGSVEQNRFFPPPADNAYFETAFSPGSSLTLETDANGDGVSGDYTVVESHFVIQGNFRSPSSDLGLGETGLTWDIVGEIHGGSGQFVEDYYYGYIWWTGSASYSATGTWQCYGWACQYENLPDGVPMPYSEMLAFMGMEPIEAVSLGSWPTDGLIPTRFDVACNDQEFSCHNPGTYVTTRVAYDYPGIALLVAGQAVPEPATAWVVAGGLLVLALRRRRSDTIRRHEVG